MKWLIFFLFIQSASATILASYNSSPSGSSEQRFETSKNKVQYVKRSNFFDKERTFTLGNFELSSQLPKKEIAEIEAILAKVVTVDKFLKKKNSDFNELSDKKPHESFMWLNEYIISKDSALYPDLKTIFDRLQALEWKQNSGIKLSDDFKKQSVLKAGKEVSTEAFSFEKCEKSQAPTICTFKDLGILYLQ
jgi:hypothetical protein